MTEYIYSGNNMKLKGIFTEEMLKTFNIPLEQAKKHGEIKLTYGTFPIYEVPSPYDEVVVFYGFHHLNDNLIPQYYFYEYEIKEYGLESIKEKELPVIECVWDYIIDKNGEFINSSDLYFMYDRKNEPKYRIKFLMNPKFDPREWESGQILKK